MRITQDMLYSNFLSNINNVNTQLYNTQTQMATGKSVNNLSDNPIALSQILTISDIQTRFDQYKSNINYANSLLSAQDTATQNISQLLQNSGSLIIQAANATNDIASNTAIAQQLQAVEAEIKNSANTMFGGNYLFSGFLTNTAPVQNITQQAAIINNPSNNAFQITTSKNFGDLNQFQSGTYTVNITSGKLSITDSNGNVISISSDGIDRSSAGGDVLSNSADISNLLQTGGWFNTGRGIKIYIPKGASGSFTFSYSPGGNNVYVGDNNNLAIAYSDGLNTPITINAKDMLYMQHQTLQSNNLLLNSSNDPATAQTKLVDLHLANALSNVALQTGQRIVLTGIDHNGNIVSGPAFLVSANATVSQLLNYITHLSTQEVLQNNTTLTLSDGTIANGTTTISQLTNGSAIIIRGLNHSGMSTTISFSANTTVSAMLTSIGRVFNVTATINHGIIHIADNKVGSSVLNIAIQTKSNSIPVFGLFNSISHGISNAFLGTVSACIQHGKIVIQDLRGGTSKLNLSINVVSSANIFGVFNTIQQGGGIDVFDAFDNAQAAILGQSVNQISKATGFSAGSTLMPTISGYYTGNNSQNWTFSVSGSSSDITASHTITIMDSKNQNIGKITMGVASGIFKITVLDSKNNAIASYATAANSNDAIASFLNTTQIQLPDGLNLTLAPQKINGTYVTPLLKNGDSFSIKLTNMLQQSITNIQDSLSQVDANRSVIGAYEQRMQLAQKRIDNTSLSNAQTLSNLQDANYAKIISDYQREITIMQALLQSFAKINQLSLFNYL
ncbi:flagellar hook-associated protein 3 FlgL [Desulfurella multipotens]|uniref:Flagellin n=1 Tax=Desulfurella multipotens TaxID=79269 RepID=A0A1G6J3B6_9BACT|nr:flagellin [Desulfurella multipotens]SDC13324.1 flagellar hook-associated protein 3 FlgL [Desulfurella multipotens]